jgi:hypothetical protein
MESKQTPIDYIKDNLFYPIQFNQLMRILNEAEQMHKEQIMEAYQVADDTPDIYEGQINFAEKYYNRNYGKGNEKNN